MAAPDCLILLFSTSNLERECELEPAIDAFLQKTKFVDLLPTVQSMLGLGNGAQR